MSFTVAGIVLVLGSSVAAQLPASLDLQTIRELPVQHDGRWPPLDTVARDLVETVTGEVFYQGHDPVLLLLGWTFDAASWMDRPLFSIANAELRAELQLPASKTSFSYNELVSHHRLHDLVDELGRVEGRKLNPLESKVSSIEEKLIVLQRIFAGQAIRAIPDPESVGGSWRPLTMAREEEPSEVGQALAAWKQLRSAFLADDAEGFAKASEQLKHSLAALPAAHRPSPKLIATELRYNRQHPFRKAWMLMVAGAVLAAVAVPLRRRWFDAVSVLALMAGFGVLTYGLWLRWSIAGRIPAANMFESLLFLSWGMGAFAILSMLIMRDRIVPLTASAMGALALILADCLPLDSYIRPIAPVLLDTVWMSIHVPIIMCSYSVLALAMLIAHVQLVVMAVTPQRRELAKAVDALHYWYIHVGAILLLVGIITGSMWAASSWGRYWGWDPKEVWSLVAFLGYLAILHVRADRERAAWWMYAIAGLLVVGLFALVAPKLAPLNASRLLALGGAAAAVFIFVLARGQFATAFKSVLAFWLIIMTYVGVNFVLGIGLHSYGFGTGAVVRYMFLIGGLDLILIVLCALVYWMRRQRRPSPTIGPAGDATG
ncbi:MAG: cytochrome c biogenesis protein CcsA [Phycisphaerales bacterium]|nr:MAG: cytochrome c biogenesis protein CcsA [Phycisphaerales bacterium]